MPVIITVRPGARRGLLRRLQALGATVNEDFTVIEASSAILPARVLRRLADDPDVVSISTDAPIMSSGLNTGVTGTANGSPYNLRRTLGLETATKVSRVGGGSVTGTQRSAIGFNLTTPQAGNRLLLVGVTFFDGVGTKSVKTVTYGTQSATLVKGQHDPNKQVRAELWTLVAPAVSTTNSVTVTLSATSDAVVVGAAVFSGVSQTAPLDTAASSSGMGIANSVAVTSTTDQSLFGILAIKDAVAVAGVSPSSVLWTIADTANKQRFVGSEAPGGTPGIAWTAGVHKEWAAVAVPINPIVTAATTFTGSGVTVAIIDSGLLQDGGGTTRIKTTRDFTGGVTSPSAVSPIDGFGHGTHVSGIIGSDQPGAVGIAPGAKYVSLRVLNTAGVGYTSHVIKAIE